MVVNRKTRISTLIAEDSKVIDTIASINKHFNKLKNPVLRRVLAPRVTIEDASKIGGVTINVFLNKREWNVRNFWPPVSKNLFGLICSKEGRHIPRKRVNVGIRGYIWPEKKKTTLLRTLVIPTTQHVTMLELRRCDYFARWRQRARDCFIFSKEKDR